jgi:hypothetical protein
MAVPPEPRRHLTAPPWRSSRTELRVPIDVDDERDTSDDRGPGDVIILSPDEVNQALNAFPVEQSPVLMLGELERQDVAGDGAIFEQHSTDSGALHSADLIQDPRPWTRKGGEEHTSARRLNARIVALAVAAIAIGIATGVTMRAILNSGPATVVQHLESSAPPSSPAPVVASSLLEGRPVAPAAGLKRTITPSPPSFLPLTATDAATNGDAARDVVSTARTLATPPRDETSTVPTLTTRSLANTTVPVGIPEAVAPARPTVVARIPEVTAPPQASIAAPPSSRIKMPPAAPSTAPPAPPAPGITETGAIQDVLQQYRGAFSDLDARAARQIWPSVNTRVLDRAFAQLETQELEFESCEINVTGARAVAACGGRARYVPKVGNKNPQEQRRQWTFDLRKVNDAWLIETVESR